MLPLQHGQQQLLPGQQRHRARLPLGRVPALGLPLVPRQGGRRRRPCAGTLTSVSGAQPELGEDLRSLQLSVANVSPSILRVTIGAPGRYVVPQGDIFQNAGIKGGSSAWGCRRLASCSQAGTAHCVPHCLPALQPVRRGASTQPVRGRH